MTLLGQSKRLGIQEIVKYKSKYWLKVFYDNCTGKSYLDNEAAALFTNGKNKYSVLSQINDAFKVKGKFEFILEWPDLNRYYQWRQTLNPVNEYEKEGVYKAEGFEPIHNGSSEAKCWGGLVRTTMTMANQVNSLLDGCPGVALWHFAVGMYKTVYDEWYKKGYPSDNSEASNLVILWIRCPLSQIGLFSCRAPRRSNFDISLNRLDFH